ncbi:MAG: hypothetical protein EOP38_12030 [Rubrivivax sp.]|nr:MAG: hypothetical protein EOP38_12030 [Rubrivivax sp.]
MNFLLKPSRLLILSAALALVGNAAHAHRDAGGSEAVSLLSALSVALSVTAPSVVLSAGAVLVVVSVQVVAGTTVWVLERLSDGARVVIRWGSQAAAVAMASVGTAVTVTALSTGYVLSAASEVIAFVPNALGASLVYNERIAD